MSAFDMAAAMRNKEVSSREIMEAHLDQIERVNPRVNAIVTLEIEMALKGADNADARLAKGDNVGVLHGLPIAHKDLVPTKGIRTT
ncbi:uncharacterized protein METZ01_LOCUS110507, partial [marine metagenome]